MNGLGRVHHARKEYDSARFYHQQDFNLCLTANDSVGLRISSSNIAWANYHLGGYKEAIQYYQLTLTYCNEDADIIHFHKRLSECYYSLKNYSKSQAHNDTIDLIESKIDDPVIMANNFQNTAIQYFEQGKYSSSIDLIEKSLRIGEQEESDEIKANALFWLAIIYLTQNDFNQAIIHLQKAIRLGLKNDNQTVLANYYIGRAHLLANQLDSAKYYYNRFISLSRKSNFDDTGEQLVFKAKLDLRTGKVDSASFHIKEALKKVENKNIHGAEVSDIYNTLGRVLFLEGRYKNSIESYNHVVKSPNRIYTPYFLIEALEGISNNFKALGDYKNALIYHTRFVELRDSLQNDYNSQRLAKMEFDTARQKELLAHNEELAAQEKIKLIIIVVAFFLFVLLVVLYRFYRSKIKSNLKLQSMNNEVIVQKEQLEVLNKEKNKIIGVVAHDLRSPLNSVKGLVNIFKIEKEEHEKERYIDLIATSTERMTDMVNRVLDVSALESKKLDLRAEEVNLVELMRQLMINFQLHVKSKKQAIVLETKCEKAMIELDKNYLIQVIENLVSNALKYSEKKTTTTVVIENNEDKVRLSVLDQGQGIGEEEQKQLFKEFSTLTSKTTGGEKATGLGLSIVKKYVEAMKGKIWCESVLGEGSSFILEFPLARV